MSVAVCLSGHSRNYKDNFPNFNFSADVFISSCEQSGLPNSNTQHYISYHSMDSVQTNLVNKKEIIDLYKPKLYEFMEDTYIPQEMAKFKGKTTTNAAKLIHIGMMFYRIYRANILRKKYEFFNNIKYDFVIRSRFDVKVNHFDFKKDYLYLLSNEKRTIDLFFAGKPHMIDAISECYEWFINQDVAYLETFKNGEDIFKYYIKYLKLGVPFMNTFDITFNKDVPYQINYIKNGMLLQKDGITNNIINGDFWNEC